MLLEAESFFTEVLFLLGDLEDFEEAAEEEVLFLDVPAAVFLVFAVDLTEVLERDAFFSAPDLLFLDSEDEADLFVALAMRDPPL